MADPKGSRLFGGLGRPTTKWWSVGISVALALSLALAYAFTPFASGGSRATHASSSGMQNMQAQTFHLSPMGHVQANWSKTVQPRSAAQAQIEQAGLTTVRNLKAPKLSMTTQKAIAPSTLGKPMAAPARAATSSGLTSTRATSTSPLADTDFVVEQANNSNAAGGPAYPCQFGLCASVAEPSVADNGADMMMSYNWYDTYSSNGGSSWSYLDPFAEFTGISGVGAFCCDQQVIYEPSRNTMFWEQLYLNSSGGTAGIGIATAAGTNLTSWCFNYLTAGVFSGAGGVNGDLLDFPDLQFTNDNLFMTFNIYNGASWVSSVVLRMPITQLASCAGLSGSYIFSTSNFNYALTQGAQGTMWFVSNGYVSGGTTGSELNICQWQDPAGGPSCVNRSIPAFNYTGGPNCGSQDGVVTNWCTRLDSRARSVFFTKANFRGFGPATLAVDFTVGPAGSDPFPWVAIYYFEVAGLPFVTEDALFSNGFAMAYPSFAANFRGFIGGDVSFGGGTGSGGSAVDYYPGTLLVIYDPTSPTPPFQLDGAFGGGNSPDGGWGDYNTVRPMYPSAFPWIGAYWVYSGTTEYIGEAIWDRGRDHNAYLRWALS